MGNKYDATLTIGSKTLTFEDRTKEEIITWIKINSVELMSKKAWEELELGVTQTYDFSLNVSVATGVVE